MDGGDRGDDVLAALGEQCAELAGLLDGLDDAGAAVASRCPGWSVADVVLHLAQTDEMAAASLADTFDEVLAGLTAGLPASANVDDGAGAMVDKQRGEPWPAVRERWRASVDALLAGFAATDLHARVPWVAGLLSARTLATTRLSETWIHTGDIAVPLGRPLECHPRLRHIARLAWRTLPYAFARAGRGLSGPVAVELTGPGGAAWSFAPDEPAATVVTGDALDWCLVAAQRAAAADTSLRATGPDADAVLALVRTFA